MLETNGLSKSFDGQRILQPTKFDAQKGEFVSVLGPSGCGKTTLLRLIAGLETPDSGRICLDGEDITHTPSHLRDVHTVFQKYALFPHMNVFDNVAYGPRCAKQGEAEIKKSVLELLSMVGLENYENREVQRLSGGEQQRVALIRALINQPKLILLDEPMAALDAKLRLQLQSELVAIQRKFKTTFIYVTHDQQEALNMSDRVAIMNKGNIEQIGTPLEVYEYPKNYFVANFVGTIHCLDASVIRSEGVSLTLKIEGMGEVLCESKIGETSGEGRMCVRPEKLSLTTRKVAQKNSIPATVKNQTYLGTHTLTEVVLTNGAHLTVFQQNSERKSRKEILVGDQVFVSWSKEHCHFFGEPTL